MASMKRPMNRRTRIPSGPDFCQFWLMACLVLRLFRQIGVAQPTNDFFANRSVIEGTNVIIDVPSLDGTMEPGEPEHLAPTPTGRSLWWIWTAPTDGNASVKFDESTAKVTILIVYTGNDFTNLTRVASSGGSTFATGCFPVRGGEAYAIAAAGVDESSQGGAIVHLEFYPPPPNDNFDTAQALPSEGGLVEGDCLWASQEPAEPGVMAPAKSVWYRLSAPTDGYLLYEATNLAPVASWVSQPLVRCYVGASLQSLVAFTNNCLPACGVDYPDPPVLEVSAGQDYFFQVLANDSSGGFRLRYDFAPRPANDEFAERLPIEGPRATWSAATYGASNEPGEPSHFYWTADTRSLWYEWTAPTNGWLRLLARAEAGAGAAVLTAYEGTSVGNLTSVEGIRQGRADLSTPSNPVLLTPADPRFPPGNCLWVPVRAGRVYALAVATQLWPGRTECSDGGLVHCELDFGTWELATPSEGSVFQAGDRVDLRAMTPEPALGNALPVVDVWMERESSWWVAYQTVGVLTNAPFAVSLTNLYPGLYMVGALATNLVGEWRQTPPTRFCVQPSNDLFANRLVLQGMETNFSDTLACASAEPGEPGASPDGPPSVWYSWTAPVSGLVSFAVFTIHLPTSEWVSVYEGTDLTSLELVAESWSEDSWGIRHGQSAARAGVEYQFRVATSWPEWDFQFQLEEQPTRDPFEIRVLSADSGLLKYRVTGIEGRPVTIESTTDFVTWTTEQVSPSGLADFDFEMSSSAGAVRFLRARVP